MALHHRGTGHLPLSRIDERHCLPLYFQLSAFNLYQGKNKGGGRGEAGSVLIKWGLAQLPSLSSEVVALNHLPGDFLVRIIHFI